MLAYVEKFNLSKKNRILFQGKERPAKTKMLPAKLRARFITFGFAKDFRNYFEKSTNGS